MAAFVGETVLVTLKFPENTQVRGLVTDIVNQQLSLREGKVPTSSERFSTFCRAFTDSVLVLWLPTQRRDEFLVVNGPENLLDIEILEPEANLATPSVSSGIQGIPQASDDPAILSYGRPLHYTPSAIDVGLTSHTTIVPSSEVKEGLGNSESRVSQQSPPPPPPIHIPQQAIGSSAFGACVLEHGTTSATLTGPFEELQLNVEENGEDDNREGNGDGKGADAHVGVAPKHKRRRPKRGVRKERSPNAAVIRLEDPGQDDKVSPKAGRKVSQPHKKTGWRETPFLEEVREPKKQSLHPTDGSKPRGQRQHQHPHKKLLNEQNGWATEDATDIQEMGDFDFSGNLSKFDKLGTFNQFKQEDTTADEERLVTHNRLPPRPGTGGGKNLHYTENVLDSPNVNNHTTWGSGDSENDLTDAKFGSGRSSRRNTSRASIRQPPSRKSSAIVSEQNMTGSGSLPEVKAKNRRTPRESVNGGKMQPDISSSHDTVKRTILQSEKASSRMPSSAHLKPSFRLTGNNHVCPCLTPLQILELEQLAMTELGLSEDMLTENAARAISQIALQTADSIWRDTKSEGHASPVVVILAGNNKTGARAIAGARQALNHHSDLYLAVLGLEGDEDLLDPVRRQLTIFRNCGGQVVKPDRLVRTLRNAHARPDMIVDALLGMHIAFEDLRIDDQDAYFDLASWANKTASVLAIDVPSGMDASSGLPPSYNLFIYPLLTSLHRPYHCSRRIGHSHPGRLRALPSCSQNRPSSGNGQIRVHEHCMRAFCGGYRHQQRSMAKVWDTLQRRCAFRQRVGR